MFRRALRLGPVDAQEDVERARRRRQPVGFAFRAGELMLELDVQRAVVVERERVAVADRVAVERVVDEELMLLASHLQ
jgi:hypothetical protein